MIAFLPMIDVSRTAVVRVDYSGFDGETEEPYSLWTRRAREKATRASLPAADAGRIFALFHRIGEAPQPLAGVCLALGYRGRWLYADRWGTARLVPRGARYEAYGYARERGRPVVGRFDVVGFERMLRQRPALRRLFWRGPLVEVHLANETASTLRLTNDSGATELSVPPGKSADATTWRTGHRLWTEGRAIGRFDLRFEPLWVRAGNEIELTKKGFGSANVGRYLDAAHWRIVVRPTAQAASHSIRADGPNRE